MQSLFLKNVIYYWLCWIFVAVSGLSLAESRGGCSLVAVHRFLMQWLLLLQSMGSRHVGFSSCSTRAQYLWCTGSVLVVHGLSTCGAQAQYLWCTGSVLVVHRLSCSTACGIFPDQGLNHVSCIGRWTLNHWTPRESWMPS